MDLNVRSAFLVARATAPLRWRRARARYGVHRERARGLDGIYAGAAGYCASKSALISAGGGAGGRVKTAPAYE